MFKGNTDFAVLFYNLRREVKGYEIYKQMKFASA